MCILLFLRETDPRHVITTPHMMLMPQLITWTEITGNSLIIVPEKYWKTSTFLFLMNIWSRKMMYIPAELLKKLPYTLVLGIKLLKNLP